MSIVLRKLSILRENTSDRRYMTLEAFAVIDTLFETYDPLKTFTTDDLKKVSENKKNLSRILSFLDVHPISRGYNLGWIRQMRHTNDRRVNEIILTPKGLRVRKQYMEV